MRFSTTFTTVILFFLRQNATQFEEKEELVNIIKRAAKERLQLEQQLAHIKTRDKVGRVVSVMCCMSSLSLTRECCICHVNLKHKRDSVFFIQIYFWQIFVLQKNIYLTNITISCHQSNLPWQIRYIFFIVYG